MTKDELIEKLEEAANTSITYKGNKHLDVECAHIEADKLLIEFINDPDVTQAYDAVPKWYA